MAAKKSERAKGLVGTVRFNGKAYGAGDEEALAKAQQEAGVDSIRGFGVDSTDRGTRALGRSDTRRAEIAERKRQAEAEANGESGESGEEEQVDLTSLTLADLRTQVESVTDKKALQSARRKDSRSGAKEIYSARIEALDSEPGESGETDASDDGR